MPDAKGFLILRRLQRLVNDAHGDELPDAVLRERFTRGGDRDALAALVRGYGLLVRRVCWRVTLALGLSALTAGAWLHSAAAVDPAAPDAAQQAPAAPEHAKPAQTQPSRTDRYGDALPPGALLRLGTVRHRDLGPGLRRTQLLRDGKLMLRSAGSATEAVNDEVQWVDTDTGRITETWRVPGKVCVCGFSPDGSRVLVCDDRVFRLWDLAARKQIRSFEPTGEPDSRYRAVFSHDGKLVATCECTVSDQCDFGMVRVWDVHTGKPLWSVGKSGELGHWLIGFVPNNTLLALLEVRGMQMTMRDCTTGRVVRKFATALDTRWCTLSPDGKACVVGTEGGAVRVWDLANGEERAPLAGHKQQVSAVAFQPDGKTLLTGGDDPTVLVWDWPSGRRRQRLDVGAGPKYPGGRVHTIRFSADGKRAQIITQPENAARWFDLASGKELPRPAEAHNAPVWGLAIAPDGRLVSTGNDATFRVWDLDTGRQLQQHRVGQPYGATSLALSGDGRLVVTSELNSGTVLVQERDSGRLVRTFATGGKWVNEIAYAPHRPLLAAEVVDAATPPELPKRRLVVWDTRTWKVLRNVEEGSGPVFSPDGACLAGFVSGPPQNGGSGRHPTIWDMDTGLEKFRLRSDHYGPLAYSPDGRLLATAVDVPNQIELWEVASGHLGGTIAAPVHDRPNCTPAFSRDSRRMAMPHGTGVLVYDVLTGEKLHSFGRHLRDTTHVTFSADGRRLVSASADSTMLVWDVASTAQRNKRASAPTQPAIAAAWNELAAQDAKKAFRAVRVLVEAPDSSVSLLRDRLKPAAPPDSQRLQKWIANLDSDEFDTRNAATRALEQGGPDAEQAIRTVLAGTPSLEARRRLEQILPKLWATPTAEALRTTRAVWVLELIGSSEARRVLQALARGAPAALQTREALAALERLKATGRR